MPHNIEHTYLTPHQIIFRASKMKTFPSPVLLLAVLSLSIHLVHPAPIPFIVIMVSPAITSANQEDMPLPWISAKEFYEECLNRSMQSPTSEAIGCNVRFEKGPFPQSSQSKRGMDTVVEDEAPLAIAVRKVSTSPTQGRGPHALGKSFSLSTWWDELKKR